MQRVVIVGGGVGGSITANRLAELLDADLRARRVSIEVITDSALQVYKPAFLYLAFGEEQKRNYEQPVRELLNSLIDLHVDKVTRVDTTTRVVETASGHAYPYDQLVLATGSRVAPEATPGLVEGGNWFYTEPGALALYDKLSTFTGGRIVVSVIGIPHMCPVAPLEMVFLLDAWFQKRGLRDQVELVYTYPINRVHTIPSVAEWASREFARRNIHAETFFNVERIDAENKRIETMDPEPYPYDLLIAIPEHRSADFLAASGLLESGWVPADRATLQVKGHPEIYALGDTTNLPVSKAGSVAHYQASSVAANVASALAGQPPMARYDGKTICFVEAGDERATFVEFDYHHPPRPVAPSRMLHWSKLAYNNAFWLTAKGVL